MSRRNDIAVVLARDNVDKGAVFEALGGRRYAAILILHNTRQGVEYATRIGFTDESVIVLGDEQVIDYWSVFRQRHLAGRVIESVTLG